MSSTTYTFVMMIFIIAIFWLILIRPQRKREKQVNAMRSAIKAGDKIVTIGGTKAKVLKAKEESLIIEAGPNVRMEVMRERCNDSIYITGEDHFLIVLIDRNVRENLFCQFSLGGIYVADRRKDHIRNLRTGRSSGTVGTGTYGYAGDETCVIRSLVTESYDTHSDYICHSNSICLIIG